MMRGARKVAIRSNVSVNDTRAMVKAIAMDIGKEVVAYVEVQYPQAVEATSLTFKLALRNCIYNEIMAAIDVSDEGEIIARLRDRKKLRREWKAAWRKLRSVR
jgi:Ni/Fe-hydrogenase subunit HybB-like protein